jgi:hypothetical protein
MSRPAELVLVSSVGRHYRICLILPLLVACHRPEGTPSRDVGHAAVPGGAPDPEVRCDLDPPYPTDEFVSPSDGVVITTSPWIPVMLLFPDNEHWNDVRTFIDCVETTDPLAVQRNVPAFNGDGRDYLAYGEIAGLENGPHVITARLEDPSGHVAWQAARFTIERPPNRVQVNVRDAAGAPIDARVVVLRNGEPYPLQAPDAVAVDPALRDDEVHTFLVPGGATSVWLDTGDYDLIATRGPLQTIDRQAIHIDGDREIDFVVDDAFDTHPSSADFHVHTATSGDSGLNNHIRVQSLLATGLDLVAITDHEVIHDLEEEIDLVGGPDASARLVSICAVEISIFVDQAAARKAAGSLPEPGDGHMNAFPLDPKAEYPDTTATMGDLLNTLRDAQAEYNPKKEGVLELNHPRGMQEEPSAPVEDHADLFNALGFDSAEGFGLGANAWMAEESGGTEGMDFDALEIMNRGSWPLYAAVRQDWFTLLGWGRRITGAGNSDSHAMTTEWAGYPRNVAPCSRNGSDDAARDAFILCWVEAVKAGQITVTTGPLVDITLSDDGVVTGGLGDTVHPTGALTANVRVRAADWVPVPEIRLVVNGEIVATRDLTKADRSADGTLDFSTSFPVATTGADQWVIAEAGWPVDQDFPDDPKVLGVYNLVVPEYLPIGFTNPVFVDGDGDGMWKP